MEEKIKDILITVRSLKKEIKNTRHIFSLECIEKDVEMLSILHEKVVDNMELEQIELMCKITDEKCKYLKLQRTIIKNKKL